MSSWDYPAPFTLQVTVTDSDIDNLNHTNNAVYVRWCEETAWAHSESLGLSISDSLSLNRAFAITHAEYDYLMASFVNENLIIGTWLIRSDGKLRLERGFQVVRTSDRRTILRARWQLTCINIETAKPCRMPEAFSKTYLPVLVDSGNN